MDIRTASYQELARYAIDKHGIRFGKGTTAEQMREKLASLEGISLKAGEPHRIPSASKAKRFIINIQKTADPMGDRDVFCAVNGRSYLIQRGKDVSVPEEVVEVLKNAVEDRYEYTWDELTKQHIQKKREALAYPFSVLGEDYAANG